MALRNGLEENYSSEGVVVCGEKGLWDVLDKQDIPLTDRYPSTIYNLDTDRYS